MDKETNVQVGSKGIGILSILTIIFVIAKITGFLNWSWWLVFAPLLVSIGLTVLIVVVVLIFCVIASMNE